MYKLLFFISLIFVTSCNNSNDFDLIEEFLINQKIGNSAEIGFLNPGFCGSCTDYSISWLEKKAKKLKGHKLYIISTGELSPEYKSRLVSAKYVILNKKQEEVSRLGIPLSAFTFVEFKDSKVVDLEVVK